MTEREVEEDRAYALTVAAAALYSDLLDDYERLDGDLRAERQRADEAERLLKEILRAMDFRSSDFDWQVLGKMPASGRLYEWCRTNPNWWLPRTLREAQKFLSADKGTDGERIDQERQRADEAERLREALEFVRNWSEPDLADGVGENRRPGMGNEMRLNTIHHRARRVLVAHHYQHEEECVSCDGKGRVYVGEPTGYETYRRCGGEGR